MSFPWGAILRQKWEMMVRGAEVVFHLKEHKGNRPVVSTAAEVDALIDAGSASSVGGVARPGPAGGEEVRGVGWAAAVR
jgi:hypothetical protein